MTQTSPLAEASPESLDELFSTSPLGRTREEWLKVVEALRAQRARWQEDEAAGKTRGRKVKEGVKRLTMEELDKIDFSDL
jgi:hypothetical protein